MPMSPELTETVVLTSHPSAPPSAVLLCAVSLLPPGTEPENPVMQAVSEITLGEVRGEN